MAKKTSDQEYIKKYEGYLADPADRFDTEHPYANNQPSPLFNLSGGPGRTDSYQPVVNTNDMSYKGTSWNNNPLLGTSLGTKPLEKYGPGYATVAKGPSSQKSADPVTDIAVEALTQPGAVNTFSYGNAPGYASKYQAQIDDLTNQILGRAAFSYDYNADPLYKQYAEAYNRNGQGAMQNTLAQIAARTNGYNNSYANAAAQQTYNNYMQALNDKIPELYNAAYSMYQDEGNTMRNNLSMLQGLENTEYGKYQDRLSQYNTDRNFAFKQWQAEQDALAEQEKLKASMSADGTGNGLLDLYNAAGGDPRVFGALAIDNGKAKDTKTAQDLYDFLSGNSLNADAESVAVADRKNVFDETYDNGSRNKTSFIDAMTNDYGYKESEAQDMWDDYKRDYLSPGAKVSNAVDSIVNGLKSFPDNLSKKVYGVDDDGLAELQIVKDLYNSGKVSLALSALNDSGVSEEAKNKLKKQLGI